MMREQIASVEVKYAFREGIHIFTSPDIRGLYLAFKDPTKAGEEIPRVIQTLLRENEGINCQVQMSKPFEDLLREIRGESVEQQFEMPHPAVLQSMTYLVKCA